MRKIDLLNQDNLRVISTLEDKVLALIDSQDTFTQSDLQGAVSALVRTILLTQV